MSRPRTPASSTRASPRRKAPARAAPPRRAVPAAASGASPPLRTRALAKTDWPTIETLFGKNGAFGGCWCMWWRVRGGAAWKAAKGEPNRRAFRTLVTGDKVVGALAFAGDEPVGWCNVGPLADFPRLQNARSLRREGDASADPKRWAVTCFYVKAGWRRRGVGGALLEAATREAFARGATEVEGYPKPAAANTPGAFVWTGVPAMFEGAGFEKLKRKPGERAIYRLRAA